MAVETAVEAVKLELDLQIAPQIHGQSLYLPEQTVIEQLLMSTLSAAQATGDKQLTVRIVDEAEIKTLNETYRRKPGVTNVLSFPFEVPPGVPIPFFTLGDIVICAPVVQREAQQQQKPIQDHWAHLIVHGALHLLGYDHISEQQAEQMETMEITILSKFGIPDPYRETQVQ